ncbi:MAG TPA: hypothetical protein DD643_03985, partial [Synechococcus sp. UBA8638]|nr:hypothetical protein [Synechococcus sp. UBA8638]
VEVSISPAPTAEITVAYSLAGSAYEDTDFSITSLGTVTVPANTGRVTIPVVVIDDNAVEADETVIILLDSDTSYMVDSSANEHILTIEDNDNAPTVVNRIPDQTAMAGTDFEYAFPENTFNDADDDDL